MGKPTGGKTKRGDEAPVSRNSGGSLAALARELGVPYRTGPVQRRPASQDTGSATETAGGQTAGQQESTAGRKSVTTIGRLIVAPQLEEAMGLLGEEAGWHGFGVTALAVRYITAVSLEKAGVDDTARWLESLRDDPDSGYPHESAEETYDCKIVGLRHNRSRSLGVNAVYIYLSGNYEVNRALAGERAFTEGELGVSRAVHNTGDEIRVPFLNLDLFSDSRQFAEFWRRSAEIRRDLENTSATVSRLDSVPAVEFTPLWANQ